MEKVFETKNGVALFFDEDNYSYKCDNIETVKAALEEDIANYLIDADAAIMAHNLLVIMDDMDYQRCMLS